uniref:CCHC-type domain-containing protein n=1 Tax=Tanacetum cinerariifolium TaxID=118510 RepID=A0A6L2J1C6_TANCI|nr:hypothetical protein [Tanacetum cinerariifolium]
MLAIQSEDGEGSGHPSKAQLAPSTAQPTHKDPIPIIASSSHQKTQTTRQALQKVNELPQTSEPIPNVADETVYEEKLVQVVVSGAKKPRGVPLLRQEVILNGDSPPPTKIVDGIVQIVAPTIVEQRLAKKNELKARGTLLMTLFDKHQLKFNIYKDAKFLMEAIEKRFGGNKETKKVQKTILKQQYENFYGTSSESLDQIHDRPQKLISQLEILGENISQEDINLKFLRSLPSEWKTHTLIWRNKVDLEEQSLDDFFNKLKIYETEVKGSSTSSQNIQNIAFVSSNTTDSTNESVNVVPSVSVASPKAKVSTLPNVDSLNDVVIYSFFVSQSNNPHLDNEDLKQIDPDDLEEMDLKWQMAVLTMGARRFLKKTGRNLGANGTDTIGFDMSKVKCYNCHRRCHFAKECRSLRDNKNKETTRQTVPVEVSTSNALVSQCDAVGGYDWSFQAEEEPTNYALMAFTSPGSSSSSRSDNVVAHCSKACLKAYATLQTHYENLTVKYRKSQLNVISYKTGLESIEARLVVYQQNETVFEEDIKLLKLDVILKDNALVELRKKFEKSEKERNDLKLTLKFLEFIQISKYKTCEGYHNVPLPYIGNFLPSKPNLVFTDDTNASKSEANVVNVKLSKYKTNRDKSNIHRPDAPIIEDWISDSEDESKTKFVPKQREPSFVKSTKHVTTSRESVKKIEHNKQAKNLRPFYQKSRVRMTHPHSKRNVVPTALLTRSRLVSLNAARPVTTVVTQSTVKYTRPVKNVFHKAHSPGNPQQTLHDKGVINSGCSRHITGNISFLSEFEEIDRGYVVFRGNSKGGKISGKEKLGQEN